MYKTLDDKWKIIQDRLSEVSTKKIEKTLSLNYKAFNKMNNIVKSFASGSDFTKLFKMKDRYNDDKITADAKIIKYDEVIDLLRIKVENLDRFKDFICEIGVIPDENIPDDEILVNWKQILTIIAYYYDNNLKDSLLFYYAELEDNYETVIQRIGSFSRTIQGTIESYNLCMDHAYKKSETIKTKREAKFKKVINKLKTEASEYVEKIEELERDVKTINLAYNDSLEGFLQHTRCLANIKYNQANGILFDIPRTELVISPVNWIELDPEVEARLQKIVKKFDPNYKLVTDLTDAINDLRVESDKESDEESEEASDESGDDIEELEISDSDSD